MGPRDKPGDDDLNSEQLPIHEALPALKTALAARNAAVLVAPPGAGKTTVAPLELLGEAWRVDGKIIVLEPRRLAARAAAERMAVLAGEAPGGTIGYATRLDSKRSARPSATAFACRAASRPRPASRWSPRASSPV